MLRIARSLSSAVAVRSSLNSKHHFENVISAHQKCRRVGLEESCCSFRGVKAEGR
jgi:hypothetical protein